VRRAVALLLAGLVAVGCSSSGAEGADGPTAAEQAATIVLRADELPGWDAATHDTRADDFTAVAPTFRRCAGLPDEEVPDGPDASSPDFSRRSGAFQVRSSVSRLDTAADAARAVGSFEQARSADCLTDSVERSTRGNLPDGVTLGTVHTEAVDLGIDADASASLRTTMALHVRGSAFDVVIDNVLLADGPWFGRLSFVSTGAPFEEALQRKLLAAVTTRMHDAP
jgi:hypothetical protein